VKKQNGRGKKSVAILKKEVWNNKIFTINKVTEPIRKVEIKIPIPESLKFNLVEN